MKVFAYSLILGFISFWVVNLYYQEILAKRIINCYDNSQDSKCFLQNIPKYMEDNGITKTIDLIKRESQARNKSCHTEAHIVGESSLSEIDELASVINMCGDSCDYGCVHGVMAKIFRMVGIDNIEAISQKCLMTRFNVLSQDVTACFHGIGHGIAEYASYDLPKALIFCDELKDTPRKLECASGAMMEIMNMNIDGNRTLPTIDSKLCLGSPPDLKTYCLITMNNKYLIRDNQHEKSIQGCLNFDNDALKNECYSALGGEVVFVFPNDLSKVWKVCTSQHNELSTAACLEGALYSILVKDKEAITAIELCNHNERSIAQAACLKLVNELLIKTGNPSRKEVCDRLKNEGLYDCQN